MRNGWNVVSRCDEVELHGSSRAVGEERLSESYSSV